MRPLNKFSFSPRDSLLLGSRGSAPGPCEPAKKWRVLPETSRAMHNVVCALRGVGHERRAACEAHPL
jgi:hypothetical protein